MTAMRAGEEAFRAVRLSLASAGVLNAAPGGVVMLAARRPGEGVTTIAAGLARACTRAQPRPALLIGPGVVGPITSGAAGEPDFVGYATPLDEAAWSDALAGWRALYPAIIVDAGSLAADAVAPWRRLADHALLVIDVSRTRREALDRFGSELARSVIKFDGFLVNRKKFFIPGAVFRLMDQ